MDDFSPCKLTGLYDHRMFNRMTAAERVDLYLEKYDALEGDFEAARRDVVDAIEAELASRLIRVHSVSGRVKERESYKKKLMKSPARQIEDVVGVRVITYFREDIKRVEQVIRDILLVNDGTYVDKGLMLSPKEFGYKSIQFVGRVPALGLGSDQSMFQNQITDGRWMGATTGTVEFQIRSILEHAWAEVDHDLIYKADRTIPMDIRRKFALTAALLETADNQLDDIRKGLFEPGVEFDSQTRTDELPYGWVQRFIETDLESRDLDDEIVAALDLSKQHPEKYLREVCRSAELAGWSNAGDLREAVTERGDLGRRMAIACVDVSRPLLMPDYHPVMADEGGAFPGIGVYWLGLALGSVRGLSPTRSMNSIPAGRLREYAVVAKFLIANPEISALDVRDRYRAVASPPGASDFATIELG